MYLVYINPLNKNYKGEYIYEFIFSNNIEIEFGEEWNNNPASNVELTPPPKEFIAKVGVVTGKKIELDLVLNSDYFSMVDAVEDIIALGWEKESPDFEKRLVFHFGETIDSVEAKIKSRNQVFIFE